MKKNPNIFDILLVIFILASIFVAKRYDLNRRKMPDSSSGLFVKISADGKKDEIIPIPSGGEKIRHYVKPGFAVEISSSGVSVAESDCPHRICVHSGVIRRKGDAIVCVPNKIVLMIIKDSDSSPAVKNYDAITR